METEGNPILEIFYRLIPVPYLYLLPCMGILCPYMLLVTLPFALADRRRKKTGACEPAKKEEVDMKTIYLAGGCFWGMQKFFDQFEGVLRTEVGYANGPDKAPSYEEVCADSGHAETLRIDYDESTVSLTELLRYFFMVIDPLSVNRQGEDEGIQYRTGIYYTDESLLPAIRAKTAEVAARYSEPLAVEVLPLENFYPAEEYHQKYLVKNPAGYCHLKPELFHLAEQMKAARPEH
jgi:methionine-S-sulfoxide reductase